MANTLSTLVADARAAGAEEGQLPMLSNAEAWERLPRPTRGAGEPLPSWARMLAAELPQTTAALLELDLAQRTRSPVRPGLRAAMRWVSAHANHCAYAEAYALADARRARVDEGRLSGLGQNDQSGWTEGERAALEFARKMTLDSDSVTDAEFQQLVEHFGEKQAASMVLLMAWSNFQDRLLLCLDAPLEPEGPTPPLDVSFGPEAFVVKTTPPPATKPAALPEPTGRDLVEDEPDWTAVSYDALQDRLEAQRQKPTRLRVPAWDEVARNLPEGFMRRPSNIVWYRIVFGYAPELAVPFEVYLRTAGVGPDLRRQPVLGDDAGRPVPLLHGALRDELGSRRFVGR